jgi:hypothetical protein
MIGSNLLLVIISATVVIADDRTVRRIHYSIDQDITSFAGGSSINFELNFSNSSASLSYMQIETEQWLHDCCLVITTENGLNVYLKQNYDDYPKVTVYLHLRKPLLSIYLNGAADLIMHNTMKTNTLLLQISGASQAQVKVEIISELYVYISGAADMTMSGFVKGNAFIDVSGAAELRAQTCPMNIVYVQASGAGVAYVIGERVDISTSGAAVVHHKGPLGNTKNLSIGRWFRSLFPFNKNAASRTLDKPIKYYFILFFMIYFFLYEL